MPTVIPAEGVMLERILEATDPTWHQGLNREAYSKFDAAQMRTSWGRRHQRRFALVEGAEVHASVKQYSLAGVLDERPVRICGIGAVLTEPAHRDGGHAGVLVDRLLDEAASNGAEMAAAFGSTSIETSTLFSTRSRKSDCSQGRRGERAATTFLHRRRRHNRRCLCRHLHRRKHVDD